MMASRASCILILRSSESVWMLLMGVGGEDKWSVCSSATPIAMRIAAWRGLSVRAQI